MPTCLIIDPVHESLFSLLAEIGWKVDYQPTITRSEIAAIVPGYDGLIVRSNTFIDRGLLGDHPTIRFVGRAGAGLDVIDQAYLLSKGIPVLHAAEGNRDAVGEFAVGVLLSLMRNIPRADREVRELVWDREGNRGEELMGKTVGIIGYGNMGRAFARRLAGFECKVLAYDKYKTGYSNEFCREAPMDQLWEEADILSLHIPLTAETKAMIDTHYFEKFKKRLILVNTARGEIVLLTDLVEALTTGRVRGAALDVIENEKLKTLTPQQLLTFDLLRKKSNVILSPHIAGWTYESLVKINVALVNKIKALQLA